MADDTILIAIDSAGPNADGSYNITTTKRCRRVTVKEDYDGASPPTANLRQKMPPGAANFIKVVKGDIAIYTPVGRDTFGDLETVGTIKTDAGSITAQILQSMQL